MLDLLITIENTYNYKFGRISLASDNNKKNNKNSFVAVTRKKVLGDSAAQKYNERKEIA